MIFYHIDKDNLAIISGPFSLTSKEAKIAFLRAARAHCGNVDAIDLQVLLSLGIVPQICEPLTVGQKSGDPVVYIDRVIIPAISKTQAELDAEKAAATEEAELEAEIHASPLDGLTFTQVDKYIDANVTDLASAKAVLKKLAKAVLILNKQMAI